MRRGIRGRLHVMSVTCRSVLRLVLAAAVLPAGAVAAQTPPAPIGHTEFVAGDTRGRVDPGDLAAFQPTQEVFLGHQIVTGAEALGVFRFRDGATFTVGANAIARIDTFVYAPIEGIGQQAIDLTQGVFMTSGGAGKPSDVREIRTPVATIDVRGTWVQGLYFPGWPLLVRLAAGQASVGNAAGRIDLRPGDVVAVYAASEAPLDPVRVPASLKAGSMVGF